MAQTAATTPAAATAPFVRPRKIQPAANRQAGTYVATMFAHVYWMPLIPLESHLVVEALPGGQVRSLRLPLHGRSVLAAYARSWGVLCAIGFALGALATLNDAETDVGAMVTSALAALVAVATAVGAWVWVGKLSPEARAQRMAYARFSGMPVDVALLGDARYALGQSLHQRITQHAQGMNSTGYRAAYDPQHQWKEIALDPRVNDATYLAAALTLTRIEWSFAAGPAREQLARWHADLWRKLAQCAPELLESGRMAA